MEAELAIPKPEAADGQGVTGIDEKQLWWRRWRSGEPAPLLEMNVARRKLILMYEVLSGRCIG